MLNRRIAGKVWEDTGEIRGKYGGMQKRCWESMGGYRRNAKKVKEPDRKDAGKVWEDTGEMLGKYGRIQEKCWESIGA